MELMRGHHSVGEANLHLQFTPKYRRDVFRGEVVQTVCEEGFRETAGRLGLVVTLATTRLSTIARHTATFQGQQPPVYVGIEITLVFLDLLDLVVLLLQITAQLLHLLL